MTARRCHEPALQVGSASNTMRNSKARGLCTVTTRTPSVPSSTPGGASLDSTVLGVSIEFSTNARKEEGSAPAQNAARHIDQPLTIRRAIASHRPKARYRHARRTVSSRVVVCPAIGGGVVAPEREESRKKFSASATSMAARIEGPARSILRGLGRECLQSTSPVASCRKASESLVAKCETKNENHAARAVLAKNL